MAILQSTRQRKIYAGDINPLLTCRLCRGYMIKPTCITECLHTFCRSCIVKHLSQKEINECPTCNIIIHETNPMEMLRADQMLEDVIYKLIPGLQQNEELREREFNRKKKKIEEQSSVISDRESPVRSSVDTMYRTTISFNNYHRDEPQICVCLECCSDSDGEVPIKQLVRRYIRCSSQMTIAHVKKYLKLKLSLNAADQVEILCNGEIMGKDHTLEFIYMTRWRVKEGTVMTLQYRPRIDFL
ncbi:polycomb group RING finger protein 5-B [Exaiptasia diaphana]|uniref:RING-type domain-containing protein n=1 Tax=Exaiptasia diaphana TaxID=2652724 RepID=A0A913X345_EXADI|nr:polycomb group RING finger protein 5-B [Exaiptasia diaphana]KXJ15743.1 Polycomb group RING finger protein 5-A [Exaiptasia diaphana]